VEGWEPAVQLANQIAEIARQQDHHPSILIEWGKVTVQWWTHSIRGLHRNDFVMAAKVNDIVVIE
jgi:4a-hydroxytetrahydrobiopterin dehydratase